MTDITEIVALIMRLVVAIICAFLIPYIKRKVDAEKLSKAMAYAKIAVEAAEMLYKESGMGPVKKEYVTKYLTEHGFHLDTDEIDVLIESAVLELHNALKE